MSLELIDTKKLSKQISDPHLYSFAVDKSGIYLVEITASAKNHWQNHSFNKQADDELSVRIDESKDFIKEKSAKWNGNELKNLQKTVVFITYLEKGNYNWNLIPKNKPVLEQINIYRTQNEKVTFIPTINNPAEDGDRRPWYSFILVNLDLKKLTVRAQTKKQLFSFDDDDLKILIDNEPAKNERKKSHEDWFWCGKILKGKSKEFAREFPTNSSPKSIKFYSDRTPLLEEVSFEFNTPTKPLPPTKRYPTKDDPIWTGDFNDDSEVMILARAIWGEARSTSKQARIAVAWSIKNRLGTKKKWDTYHHIILDPAQYSAFWEKPPKNGNIKALQDPIGTTNNSDDHRKWKETYEMAEQIINGEIPDPTNGANHYYDDSIGPPSWAKNIKPKLEIENLNFFYVK